MTRTHFVRPVVYRLFVIDLLPQATNERARRPYLTTGLLLLEHCIQYWRKPVFELAVVVVRYNKISDTIHAASTEVGAIEREVGEIGLPETFDKVFLDAAGGGHDTCDMSVLHEVQNNLTQPGGYKVRSVAKKYVTARSRTKLWIRQLLVLIFGDRLIRKAPTTLRRLDA